jgi:NADH-quinone oxidoreductase subunit A
MLELSVYAVMVIMVAVGAIVLSLILGKPRHSRYKDTPYESGIAPTGPSQTNMSIPYYLVAISFLLFDVEVVFLYAWAIRFYELSWEGLLKAGVFIAFLFAGLVYIWLRKGLVWRRLSKTA